MDPNKTTIERAFELAKSGKFRTPSEVKSALSGEGYRAEQISGPALMRQLREIIRVARAPEAQQS
jgi:hypothetical protein